MKKLRVLVIGQTPPPYGGQALMIETLLQQQYEGIEFHHVRMSFSSSMKDMGRVKLRKIMHLFGVIFATWWARLTTGSTVMYYVPAGRNRAPMYRDIIILLATRCLFSKTIFHFQGGGVSELYPALNPIMKFFYRLAYFRPDIAIPLLPSSPPDGQFMKAKREFVIPNGFIDEFDSTRFPKQQNEVPIILFVGILTESKGILDLLTAASLLKERGTEFQLKVMGEPMAADFYDVITRQIEELGLVDHVDMLGVLVNDEKWRVFASADMFCFPTFFEAESFGNVTAEAMQFQLPVVSTQWRGIPSVVNDGETGFLVEIHDTSALADKLQLLIRDPELRLKMGRAGRERFLNMFAIERYQERMEVALRSLMEPASETLSNEVATSEQ